MFNSVRYFIKHTFNKLGCQVCAQYSVETFQSNLVRQENTKNLSRLTYGQPMPLTHPHLMKDGEIVPGIQLHEFKKRRSKLIEKVVSDGYAKNINSQIVIIPSSSKVYMSDKIPYVFRQNTDFLYFTGCQEPDSVLIMTAHNDNYRSVLFMREKDEHAEKWEGPRTGVEIAAEVFGMDQALPESEFERFVGSYVNEHQRSIMWYDSSDIVQPMLHKRLCDLIKMIRHQVFMSPKKLIHQIRLIKSKSEIHLMHESCKISSAAIKTTIEKSKSGMSEHELFATVDYECRMNGAEFLAYPPVVAGGKNANIIHYINNNQIIKNGDMILMDAGCQYCGYTSDITRTWPINGTFTSEQRLLYEIVLNVQKILIESLKDMPSLDKVYHDMSLLLGERLKDIALIPDSFSGNALLKAVYDYCPHHVSHYLGMDVHDTEKISRSIPIQPGMIITVEPGIYVTSTNRLASSNFHGLGIRIEDDVLITESGPIVLTKECPKEIEEIEALASQNQFH